jgi:hypothetical protein
MYAIIEIKKYINENTLGISKKNTSKLLSKIDSLVMQEMNQWKHADGIDENGSIIIKSKINEI